MERGGAPTVEAGAGIESPPGLRVIRDLLGGLHADRVVYCHWKSNEHLRASLLGETDLDILVERGASQALTRAAAASGFKRFAAVPLKAYPGIEDYLALDAETGRLVHLHLHYRLTVGERHLKGYRLPWESLVLGTRTFDLGEGVFLADPHVELLLLVVRAALKLRVRDRLLAALRFGRPDESFLAEYRYLRERSDLARVSDLGGTLLGAETAPAVGDLLAGEPTVGQLAAFRRRARHGLASFRTYGPLEALRRAWTRELFWLVGVVLRSLGGSTRPTRRTNPRGGVVIAFLGCDGAGKSTVSREVVRWLSLKADVTSTYLGSGQGPASLLRWPFKAARDFVVAILGPRVARLPRGTHRARAGGTERFGGPLRPLERVVRTLDALALSYEKRRKLRKANAARNRGLIVVCDRYPQNQIMGFNDGPLLGRWIGHPSRFLRALAHWESVPYGEAELCPPDLVFKLHVTPETAMDRKPDMGAEEIRSRGEAIRALRFPSTTRTVDLDADNPLDAVLLEVKRTIWEEL